MPRWPSPPGPPSSRRTPADRCHCGFGMLIACQSRSPSVCRTSWPRPWTHSVAPRGRFVTKADAVRSAIEELVDREERRRIRRSHRRGLPPDPPDRRGGRRGLPRGASGPSRRSPGRSGGERSPTRRGLVGRDPGREGSALPGGQPQRVIGVLRAILVVPSPGPSGPSPPRSPSVRRRACSSSPSRHSTTCASSIARSWSTAWAPWTSPAAPSSAPPSAPPPTADPLDQPTPRQTTGAVGSPV